MFPEAKLTSVVYLLHYSRLLCQLQSSSTTAGCAELDELAFNFLMFALLFAPAQFFTFSSDSFVSITKCDNVGPNGNMKNTQET